MTHVLGPTRRTPVGVTEAHRLSSREALGKLSAKVLDMRSVKVKASNRASVQIDLWAESKQGLLQGPCPEVTKSQCCQETIVGLHRSAAFLMSECIPKFLLLCLVSESCSTRSSPAVWLGHETWLGRGSRILPHHVTPSSFPRECPSLWSGSFCAEFGG